MANHSFFLFLCVSTLLLVCYANDENEKLHIVYMGSLPKDETYSPTSHHLIMLQQVIGSGHASNHLIQSYKRSFNGFAAIITDKQREKLANMEGVVSVFPSKTLKLHTTRSWDFIGLKHKSTKRNHTAESDIIIGVIDTGIWPESDSFKDYGFGPVPKKWKGACAGGNNFTCNNKLIGARYYPPSEGSGSARDLDGHGTHTSSTAAGNSVKSGGFYGIAEGTARGGVPSARIAMYAACRGGGCSDSDILGAFDDAIADGVDIITISAGRTFLTDFKKDCNAIGSFHAMEKGILTVNSAGNDGPDRNSTTSVSPWMLSVAASTIDRRIINKISFGNGVTLTGKAVNGGFKSEGKKTSLVLPRHVSFNNCSVGVEYCSCLNPIMVQGKVVPCETLQGYFFAHWSGAFGSLLKEDDVLESFVTAYPASVVTSKAYDLALSYANSTTNPQVEILKSEAIIDSNAPFVADFSSRGPNKLVVEIMKPDISGPGVEILAAYSPIASPSTYFEDDKRSVKYNILSGTSMSCPHVAGIAAYVKSFHPDWSPAAIKSSIMTTAKVIKGDKDQKEFAYGSGQVDPLKAIDPGLVFDLSKKDYVSLLCNIGYDTKSVRKMSGDNSTCPSTPKRSKVKDINYPSFASHVQRMKPFAIKFRRTVTNVGVANSTYKASVVGSSGLKINIVPQILSFKSLQEKQSFIVKIVGGKFKESVISSSLVWTNGIHSVRFPIVVDVS